MQLIEQYVINNKIKTKKALRMTNYFTNRDIILEKLSFDLDDFEQAIQEKIKELEKEDCFLVGIEKTSFTDSNDSDKGKHHCCFIRYVRPKYQLIWESRHTGQNTVLGIYKEEELAEKAIEKFSEYYPKMQLVVQKISPLDLPL